MPVFDTYFQDNPYNFVQLSQEQYHIVEDLCRLKLILFELLHDVDYRLKHFDMTLLHTYNYLAIYY